MVRKIVKSEHILRKTSSLVEVIDKRIISVIKDMADTMYNIRGWGLSAVQIGILKRIVVADIGEGIIILINPKIIHRYGVQKKPEGCLSIPNIYGTVKRPQTIVVKAINRKGKNIRIRASGLLARVLCHEIDHLDGILFIDYI